MLIDMREHVWQRVTGSKRHIAVMGFTRWAGALMSPLMKHEITLQMRSYTLPVRLQEFIARDLVAPTMQESARQSSARS